MAIETAGVVEPVMPCEDAVDVELERDVDEPLRYLDVPETSCLGAVDELGWSATVGLRAGGHVLGVRVNHPAGVAALESVFASRHVADATPARNLSVWLAERAAPGETQDLHRLYRSFVRQVRSRSVSRVLQGLWHELDARDVAHAGDRLLIEAAVFVHDGRAHLLNGALFRGIVDDVRRWEVDGLRLLERRWVVLHPVAGEVVVPEAQVNTDAVAALVETAGLDDSGPMEPLHGRFPVASWTLDAGELTPATRLAKAAAQAVDAGRTLGPTDLVALQRLLPGIADLGPSWTDTDSLRQALIASIR